MKIEIEVQEDKIGDKYMESSKELIELYVVGESFCIELNDKLLIIPKEAVYGVNL